MTSIYLGNNVHLHHLLGCSPAVKSRLQLYAKSRTRTTSVRHASSGRDTGLILIGALLRLLLLRHRLSACGGPFLQAAGFCNWPAGKVLCALFIAAT